MNLCSFSIWTLYDKLTDRTQEESRVPFTHYVIHEHHVIVHRDIDGIGFCAIVRCRA